MKNNNKNYSVDTYDLIIITAMIGGFYIGNWMPLIFFILIQILNAMFESKVKNEEHRHSEALAGMPSKTDDGWKKLRDDWHKMKAGELNEEKHCWFPNHFIATRDFETGNPRYFEFMTDGNGGSLVKELNK